MDWKVYYSDKKTVDCQQATPSSIVRRLDVQVIIQGSQDHVWVTLAGYDFYVWDDRGGGPKWFGVDRFGLHHYWLQPGWHCILFGTMIDKSKFNEIYELATNDPMFGAKASWSRDERKPDAV